MAKLTFIKNHEQKYNDGKSYKKRNTNIKFDNLKLQFALVFSQKNLAVYRFQNYFYHYA